MKLFFQANEIKDDKEVPVFPTSSVTCIGLKAYSVLRSLVSRAAPSEKSLADLITILKNHYCPKPVVIVERFRGALHNPCCALSLS